MAKLSNFRTDARAVKEGEWVPLDAEWGDIEIRTRGYSDDYQDKMAARTKRAMAEHRVSKPEDLPAKTRNDLLIEGLTEDLLLDVRGLTEDDGTTPVPFAKFCDFLRDEEYRRLGYACQAAIGRVGFKREAERKEAEGN